MSSQSRKQYTLRIPGGLWSWLKAYHQRRRDGLEKARDVGLTEDFVRVPFHDTLLHVLQAGLEKLYPIAKTDMSEVAGDARSHDE